MKGMFDNLNRVNNLVQKQKTSGNIPGGLLQFVFKVCTFFFYRITGNLRDYGSIAIELFNNALV